VRGKQVCLASRKKSLVQDTISGGISKSFGEEKKHISHGGTQAKCLEHVKKTEDSDHKNVKKESINLLCTIIKLDVQQVF